MESMLKRYLPFIIKSRGDHTSNIKTSMPNVVFLTDQLVSCSNTTIQFTGKGTFGSTARVDLNIGAPKQLMTFNRARVFEQKASFPCIKKSLNSNNGPKAAGLANREFSIMEKLNHNNIIQALPIKSDGAAFWMKDGGYTLRSIAAQTEYAKLYDFLQNTMKIDCKDYKIQHPLVSHFECILAVYDTQRARLGRENSLPLLIEICNELLPSIDINEIIEVFTAYKNIDNSTSPIESFKAFCLAMIEQNNNDPKEMLKLCLGENGTARLGEQFTLDDFLQHAMFSAEDGALSNDFRVGKLFSYFVNEENSLSHDFFDYCGGSGTSANSTLDHHGLLHIQKFNFGEELSIIFQVSQAVSYMHSQGIAHNDLHTKNIVLDKHGRARIIDFGLAVDAKNLRPEDDFASACASDVLQLQSMLYKTLSAQAADLEKTPQGQKELQQLTQLFINTTTAAEMCDGLRSYMHLFPNWSGAPRESMV